jgi:hypothetical protein
MFPVYHNGLDSGIREDDSGGRPSEDPSCLWRVSVWISGASLRCIEPSFDPAARTENSQTYDNDTLTNTGALGEMRTWQAFAAHAVHPGNIRGGLSTTPEIVSGLKAPVGTIYSSALKLLDFF